VRYFKISGMFLFCVIEEKSNYLLVESLLTSRAGLNAVVKRNFKAL
jgi:hypothetical protein